MFLGNDQVRNSLEDFIISHTGQSYILGGSKGLGKRTYAEIILKKLERPYVLTRGGTDIQSLRDIVRLATLRQKENTTLILDDFDNARDDAQNTFLKTLEEAPHLSFCIIAHNLDALLPTIHSRAPLFYFSPLTQSEMMLFLDDEKVFEVSKRGLIVQYSAGRPGYAKKNYRAF